jgi:formiminotetrahydrofolate cyclodeaminase
LSQGTPTPGGGSATAFDGATAAALVQMVSRLTIGRNKYQSVEKKMEAILKNAEALCVELSGKVQEDANIFNAYMEVKKKPQTTIDNKKPSVTLSDVIERITQVQLEIGELSLDVMRLALELVKEANIHAIADATCAALLARSSLNCSLTNMSANQVNEKSQDKKDFYANKIVELSKESNKLYLELNEILINRGGFILPW